MEVKTIRLNTFILFLLWMFACCSSHRSRVTQDNKLASLFSRASTVQVMSYKDRTHQTPLIEGERPTETAPSEPVLTVVGELRITENTIKEKLRLNNVQRDSLFRLLNADMCETNGTGICYDPRHAIIFFDSKDQPFGYIEICFACTNYETSENLELDFCYEKSEAIKSLFQSFGIEYFPVGE